MVWDKFIKEAEESHENALVKYQEDKEKWEQRRRSRKGGKKSKKAKKQDEEPKAPRLRMIRGEDENFLAFAAALKIMVGSSIRIDKIGRARSLLEQYLLGFTRVR